ncbi:MAG: biotin--[acetyl-CoA-carboxylase] ligase [Candidatus Marinimicrobia bacterium]|nr:biotin--[acetyl-CoA-carboxylase] ligase [Candidatus Neomarinimicrobiota bacterium]
MEQDSDRISLKLKTRFIKPKIVRFPIIDSTNSYLMNAHSYKPGTVVLADYQTAGRGRFGRSWVSPPEEALLFSILLTDLKQEIPLYIYTFLAAVGVYDGLKPLISGKFKLSLKWPNDILLNNKKVCGILVQSKTSGSVFSRLVIGIGLNINQPEEFFKGELQHAASLYSKTGKRFDRILVLTNILRNIDQQLTILREKGEKIIFNKWKNACDSIGRPVVVDDGERIHKGIFEDISENGGLVLNTGAKKVIFHAADVTILKRIQ